MIKSKYFLFDLLRRHRTPENCGLYYQDLSVLTEVISELGVSSPFNYDHIDSYCLRHDQDGYTLEVIVDPFKHSMVDVFSRNITADQVWSIIERNYQKGVFPKTLYDKFVWEDPDLVELATQLEFQRDQKI